MIIHYVEKNGNYFQKNGIMPKKIKLCQKKPNYVKKK